jgi:hypothetical protein
MFHGFINQSFTLHATLFPGSSWHNPGTRNLSRSRFGRRCESLHDTQEARRIRSADIHIDNIINVGDESE